MTGHKEMRCCDLIMKGGITSGVLFPPAIREVAKRFYLVGIGGASAGAIAAAMAAAAEFRRRQGGGMCGFEMLEGTANEMADKDNLLALFRPDLTTSKLHKFALKAKGFGDSGLCGKAGIILRAIPLLLALKRKAELVVNNGFGLCTGMANGNRPPRGGGLPISEWLAEKIDHIAGFHQDRPLIFDDLYRAKLPPGVKREGPWERAIDFQAVTTSLSFNQPFALPFQNNLFAFDPDELARYFPKKIMDYLIRTGNEIVRGVDPKKKCSQARDIFFPQGKLPLPSKGKMPVAMAARMSLSFPALFSMVPLYAVDYNTAGNPVRRVWFSDGGVTSNLPIHLFDALMPNWPTLAINLQYYKKDKGPSRKSVGDDGVYMIGRRSEGTRALWDAFDEEPSSLGDIMGWVGSIFNSARNWRDNSFLTLPGYRDRVVEIWLNEEEGGLNLEMPRPVVNGLLKRGREAGRQLVERFADNPASEQLSWEMHRWTRLRSAMAGLAVALKDFAYAANHPMPGDMSMKNMLANGTKCASYKCGKKQLVEATDAVNGLLKWVDSLPGKGDKPFQGKPNPKIKVGARAPM